jgi:hypothetical protein
VIRRDEFFKREWEQKGLPLMVWFEAIFLNHK